MREIFYRQENLGKQDFLKYDTNLRRFFHFRDGKIFQILYFPDFEGSQAEFPQGLYYSLFTQSGFRSDLYLVPYADNRAEIETVRVGLCPEGSQKEYYFVEYKKLRDEVSAFRSIDDRVQKLAWEGKEPTVDWNRLSDYPNNSILGWVKFYNIYGKSEDDFLFTSRILILRDFDRFRLITQVSRDEDFRNESTLNIEISRYLPGSDLLQLSGFLKSNAVSLLDTGDNNSLRTALDLCDLIQKKFSIFFPMLL